MSAFLSWYLVVQLLGFACLPLSWHWFRRLPDRGYGASKLLGILLTAVLLWLGNAAAWLANDATGAIFAALVVAAAGGWVLHSAAHRRGAREHRLGSWLRRHRAVALTSEAIFFVAFAVMALLRAHDPSIDHTEQPMDLMMLAATSTSSEFPPRDPWLSGYPISYYYFGYWMVSLLAHLTGHPPEVAYNLGVACWFGLLALGSFSIGINLLALDGDRKELSRLRPGTVAGGVLFAVSVTAIGNLRGTADALGLLLSGTGREEDWWWWWRASRVLVDRGAEGATIEIIDEFPAFSFVLGDLHPHVLAAPLLLLSLLVSLDVWRAVRCCRPRQLPPLAPWARVRGSTLFLLALVIGAALVTNTWDVPAHLGLIVLACSVAGGTAAGSAGTRALAPGGTARQWGAAFLFAGLLLATALLLFLPYALTAQSMASGVLPNLFHPTPLRQLLLHFGQFAPGVVLLLWLACRSCPPSPRRLARCGGLALAACLAILLLGATWGVATQSGEQWLSEHSWEGAPAAPILVVTLQRYVEGLPTTLALVLVAALAAVQLRRPSEASTDSAGDGLASNTIRPETAECSPGALSFALLLLATGAALVLVPELIYVRDGFGTRMNTIFKFYYAAWTLLAVAASYGVVGGLRRPGWLRPAAGLSLGLLLLGVVYPLLAAASKSGGFRGPATLDGLAYLRTVAPDELAAIHWVREHAAENAIVVQATGESYHVAHDRLSAATGRPTLLGWVGHELQWRGTEYATVAEGRAEAVRTLYSPETAQELEDVLERWNVEYLYVGPVERRAFAIGARSEALFRQALVPVFASGPVTLYQRQPAAAQERRR